MNTTFYGVYRFSSGFFYGVYRFGNRTRVYRFSSEHYIHLITDWLIYFLFRLKNRKDKSMITHYTS